MSTLPDRSAKRPRLFRVRGSHLRSLRLVRGWTQECGFGEPDTDELLARARDGDRQAGWTAIFHQRARLTSMVVARMDKRLRSRFDAEDVVQESMIAAADRLEEFFRQERVPFYFWLRWLTIERLIDMRRAHLNSRRRSVLREECNVPGLRSDRVSQDLACRVDNAASDPLARLLHQELCDRLRQTLDRLSPGDRDVLVSRYLNQLSAAQTAGAMGIKEGAVRARTLRALKRMRNILGDK